METHKVGIIGLTVLLAVAPALVADSNAVPPYMGQEPPGLAPKVFAPGLISLANRCEDSICLSRDGRECYFTVRAADWSSRRIMVSRYERGKWAEPVQAPFSDNASMTASPADDDQSLYFIIKGRTDADVCRVRRVGQGWSKPEIMSAPVNSPQSEWSCRISTVGDAWICSHRPGGAGGCDVWRIQLADGNFTAATNLDALNSSANDCHPVPGPNEAYIIFQSDRPGGFGGIDLYLSLHDERGGWTTPRNLGPVINSSMNEGAPYLSPDQKYLFFNRGTAAETDIYWVSVKAFLPDPNEYNAASRVTFDYLGQKPPGATPEVFAPGVVSVAGSQEHCLSFSPKGDELFFTIRGWPHSKVMHMKMQGDTWSKPEPAGFAKDDGATQAVFSPDGQYVYFSSSREKPDVRYFSLWRSRKQGDGWSQPESVADMGDGLMMEFHPSVARNGSVYFLYWDFERQTGDLYVARLLDGRYAEPVLLPSPISTEHNEVRPTVDPSERYLLFESDRPGGYGETDIYMAFRNDDGTWSSPRNLGPTINTPGVDDTPNISPDGKYWFFSKNGDVYWREVPTSLLNPDGPNATRTAATKSPTAEATLAAPPQAQDFPLSAVKLMDGPFKQAMEVDKAFLLRVEPDRLLAGFRMQAGLPRKAEPYGSPEWEAIDPNSRYTMAGHSLGHYLSGLSMMAASTGDAECRRRGEYIVSELDACQKAGGTGMLTAFPDSRGLFAEIVAGKIESDRLFKLNGGYVPFYVIHKVMAGLRDAWQLTGNRTAREVLIRQADWLATVFENLTDAQIQQLLETEHGGIMEVVADVHALTGDARHLKLAQRLNHRKIFEPLSKGEDPLTAPPGARPVHANAQIPIVIGMARLYELTGEKSYATAARAFWDNVVNTRSFVIGGHGANEFFFPVEEFATTGLMSRGGPETCNTYNMLKLSRKLWLQEPSAATADFIERCLYNHILGSQDPDEGGFAYYTPMRPGAYRVYCDAANDFWCCTGTGMENHAKYGEFIYGHIGDHLWVDLLVASELDWAEQGVKVRLETRFPADDKATLVFTTERPRELALSIRCPGWLVPGTMKLAVNGAAQEVAAQPGAYATVERTWHNGDKLEIQWPLVIRTELLPHSREWAAVLWGPIVLAGTLGTEGLEGLAFKRAGLFPKKLPFDNVPVFTGGVDDILIKVKPTPGKPLEFRTEGLASPREVTLAPLYGIHRQRYAVYWRLALAGDHFYETRSDG